MNSKLKPCLTAGLIALAAVVILALYVSDYWIAPKLPAIIGAAVILPISVLGALFIHSDSLSGKGRIWVQIATLVSAAIFGLGIPIIWAQPQARSYVIEQTPRSLLNLIAALDDPASSVSIQACHRLLLDSSQIESLVDVLQSRPKLASACLDSAPASVHRSGVASSLRTRWHQTLVTANSASTADLCLSAATLAELPDDIGQKQADLFDCAIRGPSSETRQCCATSLTSLGDTCEALAAQIDTKKLVDNNTISTLGTLSFGESTAEREFREAASFVDLQCPEMQALALKLACVAYAESSGDSGARNFLAWEFEKHQDCLPPSEESEQEARAQTHQICNALMETAAAKTTISSDMICASHLAAIKLVQDAHEKIGGLSAAQGAALATQISVGSNREAQRRRDLAGWLDSVQSQAPGTKMETLSAQDRRALIQQMMKSPKSPEELLNAPFNRLEQVQKEFGDKLAKNPALKAGLAKRASSDKNMPDTDAVGDILEANSKTLEDAKKKAQTDLKNAQSNPDNTKP